MRRVSRIVSLDTTLSISSEAASLAVRVDFPTQLAPVMTSNLPTILYNS